MIHHSRNSLTMLGLLICLYQVRKALGISIMLLSMKCLIDLWTVPTMWYFCFWFYCYWWISEFVIGTLKCQPSDIIMWNFKTLKCQPSHITMWNFKTLICQPSDITMWNFKTLKCQPSDIIMWNFKTLICQPSDIIINYITVLRHSARVSYMFCFSHFVHFVA
jgi:DNA-binding Xre family transcriptional regulator